MATRSRIGPQPLSPDSKVKLVRHGLLVVGLIAAAALFGLLRSPAAGLLAVGLAWLLATIIGHRHDEDGMRGVARTIVEYALVGMLAAVVTLTLHSPAAPADSKPPPVAAAQPPQTLDDLAVPVKAGLLHLRDRTAASFKAWLKEQTARSSPTTTTRREHR